MSRVHCRSKYIVSFGPREGFFPRIAAAAVALCGMVFWAAGCGASEPPIGTVAIGVNRPTVPLGGPLEMTFRFVTAPQLEELNQDYRVLVHFLDDSEELMWADDHQPPVPTSSWIPGQTISYTRHTTVPMYPYVGDATIAVGLYSESSGERLTLAGDDLGQKAYRGGVLRLEPQAESSFMLYDGGWYDDEYDSESNQQWRWTSERASVSFRNPRSAAMLYLRFDGRPDLVPGGQQSVEVRVEGELVQSFVLTSREPQYEEVEIGAEFIGEGDTSRIGLHVSPTFVPSEADSETYDSRRLGVRFYYVFVEPE